MTHSFSKKSFASKALLLVTMLLFGFASQAQISMPSTYKYTKKVFGDARCSELTSYFIFKSADNVLWCCESSDGYIFPIAIGKYNAANRKLIFSKGHSTFHGFNSGDITFDVMPSNGNLFITQNRDDLEPLFSATEKIRLNRCEYDLNPSNKLIGSSWKIKDGDFETNLYFKTDNKVLLNGEPRVYILIGNALGFLSGDNPTKEAVVGNWRNQSLEIHRSGLRSTDFPWLTLERID